MNSNDLGTVPPQPATDAPAPADAPADNGGVTNSETNNGTGDGVQQPQDQNTNQEHQQPEGGEPKEQTHADKLMSRWQSEQNAHQGTQSELAQYKATYGELPPNGQPVNNNQQQPPQQAQQQPNQNVPKALQPDWNPQSMDDLKEGLQEMYQHGVEAGKQGAIQTIQEQEQAQAQAKQQAEALVNNFVAEVKGVDSEFNDKMFFEHVTRFNLPVSSEQDLRNAYMNFHEFNKATASARQQGAQNAQGRQTPVQKPGGGQTPAGSVNYKDIANASSARDLIRGRSGN